MLNIFWDMIIVFVFFSVNILQKHKNYPNILSLNCESFQKDKHILAFSQI